MKGVLILGAMLVAASAAAALAPLRPDQRVAPPAIDLPERELRSPSGASDGTNVFAAWTDELGRVFGARFDRQGKLLDPVSTVIDDTGTTLYGFSQQPSVFFTGHHYLVLYTAGWYNFGDGEVRARRVGTDGRLLDAQPRVLAAKTWLVAAASNGTRIATLLHDGSLQMIDFDGNALEPPRAEFGEEISRASLTASGDGFLVIARTAKGLIVRTIGSGKPDVSLSASPFTFRVVSKGSSHEVLYYESEGLWAFPIQTGGPLPVVGPRKLVDSFSGGTESLRTPTAVPDGNGFVVVWRRRHEVMAQRLSFDGLPIDAISTLRTVDAEVSDLVSVAGRFAVLGSMEATANRQTVTAMLFHADGLTAFAPAESVTVARLPRRQFYPAIGTNGFTSLVAWYESASPSSYLIRAALIDGNGTVGPPIELATGVRNYAYNIGPFALPAVASDGRDFLVVWSEGRSVAGRRIGAQGQLLGADPIRVANGLRSSTGVYWDMPASDSRTLAAAWNGRGYVVAFSDQFDVRAAIVTRDGAAVTADPSPLLSDSASPLRQPIREIALVCGPARCTLAYRKGTTEDGFRGFSDDGGVFAIPVVPNQHEILFAHTPETLNLAAVQKSDGRAIVFVSRGTVTLGSRIAANGSAVDGGGVPLIANEPASTLPLRVTAIGDGIYWGEQTILRPRLRWSRMDFNTLTPEVPVEIDAIAPVAITVANGKLLVVYSSADSFFVRVYAAPDAPAAPPRRRAAR